MEHFYQMFKCEEVIVMLCFDVVERQVISAYSKVSQYKDMLWTLEEVKEFFKIFYDCHNAYCRYAHPFLKNETIERIIYNLGFDDNGMEYSLNDYKYMIPQYFRTRFYNCDYSIVHFMSGDVRLMRYYEVQFLID